MGVTIVSDILPSVREAFKLAVKDAGVRGTLGKSAYFRRTDEQLEPVCPIGHTLVALGVDVEAPESWLNVLGMSASDIIDYAYTYDYKTVSQPRSNYSVIAIDLFDEMFPSTPKSVTPPEGVLKK